MPGDEALLTCEEVARILRVHPKHVYRLLDRGLPALRVGGKWLFRQSEVMDWATHCRKGSRLMGSSCQAQPLPEPKSLEALPPLVAANGDLAVEMLLAQLKEHGLPLLGLIKSDRGQGLELLKRKLVLASGWHGHATPPRLEPESLAFVQLVEREVGLVGPKGKPLPTLEDLAGLRLASRPPTAGIRVLLDEALARQGLDTALIHQEATLLDSHCEVVCAVARGQAQVGISSRAWAYRLGLGFQSLGQEVYSLLLPRRCLTSPAIVRLCDVAQSGAYRKQLEGVAGYDTRDTGAIRFSLPPDALERRLQA